MTSAASGSATRRATLAAMERNLCRAPTRAGQPCSWPVAECPVADHRRTRPDPVAREPTARTRPAPAWLEQRDLHAAAWWVFDSMVRGELKTAEASVAATLIRVLSALGPAPADPGAIDREVAVRALLMHGLLPRNEDEWTLARELFGEELLAMVQDSFERRERAYSSAAHGEEDGGR